MRRSATVTIDTPGRDYGKTFAVVEASPVETEDWCARVLIAMKQADVKVPSDIAKMNPRDLVMTALHNFGQSGWGGAKTLLREMLTRVFVVPDPGAPFLMRDLGSDDIEELTTLIELRLEVVKLHIETIVPFGPSAMKFTTSMTGARHGNGYH